MRSKYLTKNPSRTKKLGELLAKKLLKEKKQKGARVLGLEGELGGGKTTFLQGFAKGLGIKKGILSPSFVIMKKYTITTGKQRLKKWYFYHFDCYRIEKPKEILNLGWKGIVRNPQNIIAVEWGDKIKQIFPTKYFQIKFNFISKNTRKISFLNKDL